VQVPQGRPVAVDGVMQPDEWRDALAIEISEGASLRLKLADGSLFLGLSTQEPVVGNVLVQTGSSIRVMHSSAALGTAVYTQEGDLWRLVEDFVWQCRGRLLTEAVQEQRATFLAEEGWLASVAYMGEPNHVEYQIADPFGIGRLTLVFLPAANPSDLITWPEDVTQDILPGPVPAEAHVVPEQWPRLILEGAPPP
jgi:hypothetical protein